MEVEGIPRGRASPPQTPPALDECKTFYSRRKGVNKVVLSWLFKYVGCPVWGHSIGSKVSYSKHVRCPVWGRFIDDNFSYCLCM